MLGNIERHPIFASKKENKSEVEYNEKKQEVALSREDCRVLAVKEDGSETKQEKQSNNKLQK